MKTSKRGVELIKQYEGCKLYAYRDAVGVPTIGYGHTKNVYMGMAITKEKADEFLVSDIEPIEKALNILGVPFMQQQFDALVSWIFNLGIGNFNSSTMKKFIMARRSNIEITDQMVKWHNAGGKPLLGLKKRRVAEANMWLGYKKYCVDLNGKIKKR